MGRFLRFGCFVVDQDAHQVLRDGVAIRLRDQSFRILARLVTHSGEVVTRQDLRRELWANDTFVDFENGLNTAMGRLREALGDAADRPRYIETLPRVGYRFIAQVTEAPDGPGPTRAVTGQSKTRLLVLPLTNANGDPSLDYFSDAITDELIGELASVAPASLGVIARTTAMHYKGTTRPIGEIARELSLDWVIEGSVRRLGDRFSLTTQLIRASDETHVLARRCEAELGDIFTAERSVAEAVRDELGLSSSPSGPQAPSVVEAQRPRTPTKDLAAYDQYILGRYHTERGQSPQSWATARTCLETAVARDPQFALAHEALASLWWYMGFFGFVSPKDSLSVGRAHARRAVEADGGLAEARAMLAQYQKQLEFDWGAVAREMALALELNPASPVVRMRYATTGLMPFGRLNEAIAELEIALKVDPLGLFPRMWLLVIYWLNRQYDRSLEQARILLDVEPRHFLTHFVVGLITREVGQFPEAIAAHRRSVELSGGSPLMLGWLGLALAQGGERAEARAILERMKAMPPQVYVPPTGQAWIHLGLGEIDAFFEWMIRAIDARDHMITPVQTYPFLDSIRSDPRYEDLLRRMKLR